LWCLLNVDHTYLCISHAARMSFDTCIDLGIVMSQTFEVSCEQCSVHMMMAVGV